MTLSAIDRRSATQKKIVAAAQELAIEHGYDGFTLNDLAAAVGVSRRTLFNHVTGKEQAVLGPEPDITCEALEEFVAGRPTGRIFDDLFALVLDLITREQQSREEVLRFHRLMETNPQLLHHIIGKFDALCAEAVSLSDQRPGQQDPTEIYLAGAILGAMFGVAIRQFVESDDDRDVVDHILAVRRAASGLNI